MAATPVQKAHANLGGSAAKRFMNCPGSPREIEKIPAGLRDSTSAAALEGTAAHALLEKCLNENKAAAEFANTWIAVYEASEDEGGASRTEFHESKIRSPVPQFEIDADMVDGVQICLDYVAEEMERLGKGAKLRVEKRVYPLEEYGDIYGTADVILFNDEEIVIIDFKYGFIIVEVRKNEQLRFYASGAIRKFKRDFEKVTYAIVQPRAHHEDGPVRSETVSVAILAKWTEKLRLAVKETEKPNAKLRAGSWCTFCDALPTCKTARQAASEQAAMDFEDDPAELAEIDKNTSDFKQRLEWIPFIENWCKSTKAYAYRLAMAGEAVPGKKLVRGKSRRTYRKDVPEKILQRRMGAFLEERGVEKKAMFSPAKLKTCAQMEKLVVRKDRKLFNKKFLTKPEGQLALVDEKDPRDAVVMHAGDDFED
jgi:hypothetical protein